MPVTCKNRIYLTFDSSDKASQFINSIKLPSFIEPNTFDYNLDLIPLFEKYDRQNNITDIEYNEQYFLTRTSELEFKNINQEENIVYAEFESISNIFSNQSILKLSKVLDAEILIKFYEEHFFYGMTKSNKIDCHTVSDETELESVNDSMFDKLERELELEFKKEKSA